MPSRLTISVAPSPSALSARDVGASDCRRPALIGALRLGGRYALKLTRALVEDSLRDVQLHTNGRAEFGAVLDFTQGVAFIRA
jgi:histidinol phosphatase-like enzyme